MFQKWYQVVIPIHFRWRETSTGVVFGKDEDNYFERFLLLERGGNDPFLISSCFHLNSNFSDDDLLTA